MNAEQMIDLKLPDGSTVEVAQSSLPKHVAIIMDGNGRWAKKRAWQRIIGHEHGVGSVREIATASADLGLKQLTLYAFSSENWARPKVERDMLFKLLGTFLVKERDTLMDNNIRLSSIGEIHRLPEPSQQILRETYDLTANNDGLILTLALSYGSRDELIRATKLIAKEVQAGALDPADIDESTIKKHLYDPDALDPDLLIRTAGEMRISNFLLWQISYSEIYVTDEYWPDFRRDQYHQAIYEFTKRKRRFGGLDKA